ncbi:cyclic GMP-AMP synthase [Betta splendens]|uniref:Cyclic GMP-AMP synthase n=1 Tax=Betta splendens TaxID=158456 RepID=A0A6P7NRY1_BETSP|nr:cyclic GMP-AMP synthase [Betta splendens]
MDRRQRSQQPALKGSCSSTRVMDREDEALTPADVTPNAGQRSSGGGSAVRKRKQLPKQQQQPEDGCSELKESSALSPEVADWIKDCARELKIRKDDRSRAAEVVNDFRDSLLKFLKSSTDQPFFQSAEFLNTGSYFEKVKIHSPDEFDMMLKLQAPARFQTTMLDDGLFYRLDLLHPTRSPMKAFVLENELTVSPSRILSEMYRLVRKFLKAYTAPDPRCCWEVNRKRPSSPAVTLSLRRTDGGGEELISVDVVPALVVHSTQGWPQAVRRGPNVDEWLGKKERQEIMNLPCIFVPKRLKGPNAKDTKESWRISFSLVEKEMIKNHGHTKTCCEANSKKCCRKQCLMLLKSLIEGLKQRFPEELEDLCSYHGKTAFLHTLSLRSTDAMWAPKQLPVCFLNLLETLEEFARRRTLPHYFVPECNLFSTRVFHRKSLDFLVSALKQQRAEGLPLLKPPGPVSPLRPVSPMEEPSRRPPMAAAHDSHFTPTVKLVFALTLVLCVLYIIKVTANVN